MHKRKRDDINLNQILPLLVLVIILVAVLKGVSFWAIWWLPFAVLCVSGRHWSDTQHDDDYDAHSKRKNDDIDYV